MERIQLIIQGDFLRKLECTMIVYSLFFTRRALYESKANRNKRVVWFVELSGLIWS